MVQLMLYGFRAAIGCTAFLAEPMLRPGESMGGPAGAGVGLQAGAALEFQFLSTSLYLSVSVFSFRQPLVTGSDWL